MGSQTYSTDSGWVNAIIEVIEDQGYTREDISRLANIQLNLLGQTSSSYEQSNISKLWKLAFEIYGDEAGLVTAKKFRPSHWPVLGITLQSSRTIDDFFNRLTQYSILVSNLIEFKYDRSKEHGELSVSFISPASFINERYEAIFGAIFSILETIIGNKVDTQWIELTRKKPLNDTPWKDFFGENIKWGSSVPKIVLSQEFIDKNIPNVDDQLSCIHDELLLSRVLLNQGLSIERIQQQIINMLPNGKPSLEEVSSRLNMSARTLQRHLEKKGTSFREILKFAQLKLAKYYLCHTRYTLSEIALMAGYSNQSNFSNSFKGIEKISPNKYRNKNNYIVKH